jgi:hypothetical protein
MLRKPPPSNARLAFAGARAHVGAHQELDIEAELERRNAFLQLLQIVSVAANGAPTSMVHALQTTLDEVCHLTGWTVGHALLPDATRPEILTSSGIWHVDDPARLSGLRQRHHQVRAAPRAWRQGRTAASATSSPTQWIRTAA